jgi:hypothetical protein
LSDEFVQSQSYQTIIGLGYSDEAKEIFSLAEPGDKFGSTANQVGLR